MRLDSRRAARDNTSKNGPASRAKRATRFISCADGLRTEATGGRYTRYCDDMVFSWRLESGPPSDFESGVRATLHEFGYTLHPEKGWRVHQRRDEPETLFQH